jgi:ubiquinone/menaquinone biosynthesis C-methylase UbiE
MSNKNQILNYWNQQAVEYKQSYLATNPDLISNQLEINEMLKYLHENQDVLNIGCGNGHKDFEYCKRRKINLKSIDFSGEMINVAKEASKDIKELEGKVSFEVGDVLNLNKDKKYDIVMTNRCLINLQNDEEHKKAIDNIYDILKPNGIFLMMECTKQGLKKISDARKSFDLEPITERWHNYYIDEDAIIPYIESKFTTLEVNNFNSTYFLISRTINALVTSEDNKIDYLSDINKLSAKLPSLGDYAPLKLFIIRK